MNIKIGVVFDLDGVLVKTDKYHYLAWKEMADYINVPFNEDINNKLRGVSRMESLNIILGNRKYSQEEKKVLADKKNVIYRESLKKIKPNDILPGVTKLLDELDSVGIKMAIGSSSKNAQFILNQLNLSHRFTVIIDGTHISKSKPDPEVFLKAAKAMEISPCNCLVFEDAKAGVKAGLAGNMPVIGVGPAMNESGLLSGIESMEDINVDKILTLLNTRL